MRARFRTTHWVLAVLLLAVVAPGCATAPAVRGSLALRTGGPPPPPRRELIAPRPGLAHVWISGHWNRQGSRWIWISGRWVRRPRPGAVWVAPRYERRSGGWVVVRGYWR